MTDISIFHSGGYRYIRGPFQYSGGVAAEPGFTIERVRFSRPVALDEGFARIKAHLGQIDRPLSAFCACELRSRAPFSEQGFIDFNRAYVGTLESWGLFKDEQNPVARSNVCPAIGAPSVPSFHAFCYTVAANDMLHPSFVISGSAEVVDDSREYADRIIRAGETATDAIKEKAGFVLATMEERMAAFGTTWADSTATHIYTVHDIHPFLAEEIVSRGAAAAGFSWVYARPPVVGLEYEMDVRGVYNGRILAS